jgi:hypothetical protein
VLVALAGCRDATAKRSPPEPEAPADLAPVAEADLCTTHGKLDVDDGTIEIDAPAVRAVALGSTGDAAALRFTYGGPSDQVTKLASGQVRKQLGLKLRAGDGCNLVYVMWRLDPKPGIEVSIKRTPGARDHEECGVGGYTKIKPKRSKRVRRPKPGVEHLLEAKIDGDDLTAWVDGKVVWRGELDEVARELSGPAGLRTDNVRVEAELLAVPGGPATRPPGC